MVGEEVVDWCYFVGVGIGAVIVIVIVIVIVRRADKMRDPSSLAHGLV